jgi:hypothetical protein
MFRQAIKWVKANQDLLIDISDQIWVKIISKNT